MLIPDGATLFELLELAGGDSPAMTRFRMWRDREVLPAILATRGYVLDPGSRPAALASNLSRMPLPPEAGLMLTSIAEDPSPYHVEANAEWWTKDALVNDDDVDDQSNEEAPQFDGMFFRQLRRLQADHNAEALRDFIDDVVLPTLFNAPGFPVPQEAVSAHAAITGVLNI